MLEQAVEEKGTSSMYSSQVIVFFRIRTETIRYAHRSWTKFVLYLSCWKLPRNFKSFFLIKPSFVPCLLLMFNFEGLLLFQIANISLAQLFSIISLNLYFKKKISTIQSISLIDKSFDYFVLAFTGNVLIGKMVSFV